MRFFTPVAFTAIVFVTGIPGVFSQACPPQSRPFRLMPDTTEKIVQPPLPGDTVPGQSFTRKDLVEASRQPGLIAIKELQDTVPTPIVFRCSLKRQSVTEKKDTDHYNRVTTRETVPVNKPNVADAYPFLSADGLRLYFTSNRQGGHGRLFISRRNSVNDVFGEPEILSRHIGDGLYGGTLTLDELTLCVSKKGALYISTRTTMQQEFPAPVKLEGTTAGFHFGPAISPDGREIIAILDGSTATPVIYHRTGSNAVVNAGRIVIGDSNPAPGQFSKDGLSFLIAITHGNEKDLWKYTRSSTAHVFSNPQPVPAVPGQVPVNRMQPSVNGDGTIMVYVTSPGNSWNANDILLATNNKGFVAATALPVKAKEALMSFAPAGVYPNPFRTSFMVDLGQSNETGTVFSLFSVSGQAIRRERINGHKTSLSCGDLMPGVYMYRLENNKGELIGTGKLVKTL